MGFGKLKSACCIVGFLGVILAHGLTVSVVAPILSVEGVEERGISTLLVGVIVGADDVAIFLVSLITGHFVDLENSRFLFVAGAAGCILSNIIFSFSNYIGYNWVFTVTVLTLRCLQGTSFAFSWTAGLIYMLKSFTGQDALLSGLAELALVCGVTLGPVVGNSLHAVVSYTFTFSTVAIVQAIFVLFFLISSERLQIKENEKCPCLNLATLFKFYLSFSTQVLTLQMLAACSFIGFCETMLTLHFHGDFGLELGEVSLLWGIIGFSYLLFVPISMYLSKKGCFLLLPFAGAVLSIALLVMALPGLVTQLEDNVYYETIYLFLSGGSSVSCLLPMYMVLTLSAHSLGISNSSALVSGVINAVFAMGGILGPVIFGGALYEALGFRFAGLCLFLFVLFSTIVTTIALVKYGILVKLCCDESKVLQHGEHTQLIQNTTEKDYLTASVKYETKPEPTN